MGIWKLENIRTRATCMYFLSALALIISAVPVQTANFILILSFNIHYRELIAVETDGPRMTLILQRMSYD